jgi:hypothetical protein
MDKTKSQRTDPKQIKQFFANAQKRAVAARKNLAIEPETEYQIAYEAMIKAPLALMLSHGQRPRLAPVSRATRESISRPREFAMDTARCSL